MYRIYKNETLLSIEDKLRYTKHQENGIDCLCTKEKADGIVIENSYIEPLAEVTIKEFNGSNKLKSITSEGAALAQASTEAPPATVGILVEGFPEWEPGVYFEKQYSLFTYNGDVGFTRQAGITAMEHQPPFSTGMESVYGIRPVPDDLGIYPYRYNMAASVGMRVRDDEGTVWRCYNAVDPMLWPPSELAAHFEIEAIE